MLERMIVDLSKWIGIIAVFFLAFACSLFIIYSPFARALDQHDSFVAATSLNTSLSTMNSSFNSSTTTNVSDRCPEYFYQLWNQSQPVLVVPNDNKDANNTDNSCQQSSNYGTLTKIGSYPAVYYFGRSFESTLLTIFFTLFGVFGENGVAVSNKTNHIDHSILHMFSMQRIVATN
jgi:hypothetical protein